MDDKYFKQDAKQLVDMLFDTKMFKEDTTRDDMTSIEDLIEFLLQSRFDTYIQVEKLNERINGLKRDNTKTIKEDVCILNLSSFVKQKRKYSGKTQKEFSEYVGVGLRFLRELEQNHKCTLRSDKINKVLDTFDYILAPVPKNDVK